MRSSSFSEPPSVKWFTEGEFWWRTGAATAWLLVLLPFVLLLFSLIALINIFHPFIWIAESVTLIFSFSFWLSVCIYGALAIPLMLSYAKFNTVKDVVYNRRVSVMLYPLHPARILHIILFSVCGAILAWCCAGISSKSENYFTIYSKNLEAFCLNEHVLFRVLFGAWLGFYSGISYFTNKEFHFAFPRIQQQKFFQVKMVAGPCIRHSIVCCFKALRWYYPLYYLFGNLPRDAIASTLGVPLDREVAALNTVSGLLNLSLFWLLFSTGSVILFVWNFGNNLLVIFHTQVYTFPVESSFHHQKEQCLCVVIKERTIPLLKYLAMFDLWQLSQFSSNRRKQIFSLTQPGGRPANWSDISSECLFLVDSLTSRLTAEVSLQTHLQQPDLDMKVLQSSMLNNGQQNGHAVQSPVYSTPYESPSSLRRQHGTLSSPESDHLWSAPVDSRQMSPSPRQRQDPGILLHWQNLTTRKMEDFFWRVKQVPHDVACSFKEKTIIGYFFNEIPESRTQAIFADCQLSIWAVEALSRLVAFSYSEDTFGVVQKSIPDIFVSLVDLLQALDQHSKLSLALTSKPAIQPRPPRPQAKDGLRYLLRATLVSSIYRITNIFHEHLRSIPMTVEHEKRLHSFLEFRE